MKISFLVSILGLVVLLIFVQAIKIDESSISKLDQSPMDTKITGEITKIRASEKVSTITIKQDCKIDVVIFDNISEKNLKVGDMITVTGRKEMQDGIYQINADEIVLKSK